MILYFLTSLFTLICQEGQIPWVLLGGLKKTKLAKTILVLRYYL